MLNVSLFSFVDLIRFRSRESLERGIGRLMKADEGSIPIRYYLIRSGIKQFCFTGFAPDVLPALLTRVMEYVPKTKFQQDEKANCMMAVGLAQSMPMPTFPGVSFEEGEAIDLNLGGITLHVVTDATLTWIDANDVKHVGAIKSKIKKRIFPRESAEMAASLLAKAMMEKHPDAIVDPHLCLCYDVFRQRLVPANNLSRNLEDALKIAEMIASRGGLAA